MHFDQREQRALREAGLDTEEIRAVADRVAELADETADDLRAFFADRETVYSDMDRAHAASDVHEHDLDHLDLYTHAEAIRGYLQFDTWGVPVEGGRVLDEDCVEVRLGGTVGDRVRFASERSRL